jgi:hypothetical protein
MLAISGCGRQVTGLDQLNGGAVVPAGQTLIRFETAGQLDFQNLTYLIVFNTSGNGQQPYAQGYNTDFKNWSYMFVIGGGSNFANAPGLLQVYQDPSSGSARTFQITIPTGTVNFQASIPSGNSQFGFQITFNRCLLDNPPPSANPPPPVSSNRVCGPYTYINQVWNVSLFTLDSTQSPKDSLSPNGPTATDYTFSIDTSTLVQPPTGTRFKPGSNSGTNNPSAQIVGVEIFSTPGSGLGVTPSPTPTAAPSRAPV